MSISDFREKFAAELGKVKIKLITQDEVGKLLNKGLYLSPVLEDELKRIIETGKSESFGLAVIGNMIHCIPANN